MRYTGPVRFAYHGDRFIAQQYATVARKLLGVMLASQQVPFSTRSLTTEQGVRITVSVVSQPQGPERNRVDSPIAHAWGSRYLVSAHIFAPPQLERERDLGEVLKVYQYQFVYTGGAGKLWDVEESSSGLPLSGGSAVGVVFVIRENGTDHAAFPLVSTIKEPPEDDPDAWLYYESIKDNTQQWIDSLIVPRYEVGHASAQHLFLPDEENIVHAPWMPKGKRHYLAQAFTPSTLRQAGTLNMAVNNSGSVPIVFTFDSPWHAIENTDVGYEAPLDIYQRPDDESPYTDDFEKGTFDWSAADADWYMSCGVYEAELPNGTVRRFGIFIDSAQTVHAWPLEAAGTGSPDPAYEDQLIKTNVDDSYVKSQPLSFPPDVYADILSYRDQWSGPASTGPYLDSPFEDTTRYGWKPSPDGKKYVGIVERLHDPLVVDYAQAPVPVAGVPPLYFDAERAYRVSSPAVATFEIEINAFGEFLGDFTLSVTEVTTQDSGDFFYPVQADFAQESAFDGVDAGDLLVAGFEAYRLEETVDDWQFVKYLAGEASFPYEGWFSAPALFLNCNAVGVQALPAPLSPQMGYNDGYRHYVPHMPPYMLQDQPFVRLYANVDPSEDFVEALVLPYYKSFAMEGLFTVRNASQGDDVVFSKCCRKFKPNTYDFGNFFTAKVCSLNLATGSVLFGLCESTTHITSAEFPVGRFDVEYGAPGNWYPHEGRNESTKGYAVFHKGILVENSNQPLTVQLDTELDSFPLSKELSFWGTVCAASTSILPSPSAGQYGFVAYAFNTQYISELLDAGESPSHVSRGSYGVRDFPWGLEMYGWFARNHFSANSAQEIVAGEDLVAYTGTYVSIENEVAIAPMSNEAVGDPQVGLEHVDFVWVGSQRFTHRALYEEAFGEAADVDFDVRFENVDRSPIIGGGSAGYPYRLRATTDSDPDTWGTEYIHAPFARFYNDDDPVRGAHLLMPDVRVYCDIGTSPGPILFNVGSFGDIVESRKEQGVMDSPFVAKAFGLVEIEDGD